MTECIECGEKFTDEDEPVPCERCDGDIHGRCARYHYCFMSASEKKEYIYNEKVDRSAGH